MNSPKHNENYSPKIGPKVLQKLSKLHKIKYMSSSQHYEDYFLKLNTKVSQRLPQLCKIGYLQEESGTKQRRFPKVERKSVSPQQPLTQTFNPSPQTKVHKKKEFHFSPRKKVNISRLICCRVVKARK